MNSIGDRIKKVMEALSLTTSQLERDLNVGNGTIQKALKRDGGFGSDILEKIVRRYAISPVFLLTGTGEIRIKPPNYMANQGSVSMVSEINEAVKEVDLVDRVIMNVPLVGQYAYAGYFTGYQDEEYMGELPTIPWVVDKEHKGSYLSFEIKNDSMFDGSVDSYKEGDLVLAREIKRDLWNSKLHFNKWDFILVHKTEGILIKKIIKHQVKEGLITIHSLNTDYPDQVVKLDDLLQLFNVVKVERKK